MVTRQVVSLESKIMKLEAALAAALAAASGEEERRGLEADIAARRADLASEKRAVMRDWLKTLFRGQVIQPALSPLAWS